MKICSNTVKREIAKCPQFKICAETIFNEKLLVGIARLSEFGEECCKMMSRHEFNKYFYFIDKLLDYCEYPSTAYLFIEIFNNDMGNVQLAEKLFSKKQYAILNKINDLLIENILQTPTVLNIEKKSLFTNFHTMDDLTQADCVNISADHWHILKKILAANYIDINFILPVINMALRLLDLIPDANLRRKRDFEIYYGSENSNLLEKQVAAFEFILAVVEKNENTYNKINTNQIFDILLRMVKKFNQNTFVLNAVTNFLLIALENDSLKADVINIVLPILINFIINYEKNKNQNYRTLAAFSKNCLLLMSLKDEESIAGVPKEILSTEWSIGEY